ncbi:MULTISPECIES: penicillin-binding protein 2 [unclassified Variovorax]|uniref:penicillin-binding protein 2 n=1 Tax=unclassified Variovorax TaxID=663243 RepID=UPI0025770637|nr:MULTISPECIES: penicillin-binding protein 2 [unclassified Variovorax]MDM0090770.1 penicillin-binding protein 2 [Variovorax sp. J22G40]MDM0149228.1 penicillin-binding protein 2 [Variovorax sp. J2P1-31]
MTEIRNAVADQMRFRRRVFVIAGVVLFGFGLLSSRLVYLQVTQHEDLSRQAESNRTAIVPVVPNRGLIVDRNGIVLASNEAAYTLELTPSKAGDIDAALADLQAFVPLSPRELRQFRRQLGESRRFDAVLLRSRLSEEEMARFAAQRYRFPGIEIKARLLRTYPHGETGAHVIGYIGRINQREKTAMDDWDDEEKANYRGTDHIGKLGIEQSYEKELHGQTGAELMETSAGGYAVRRLSSHPSAAGRTVMLSLDIKLQKLVEDMFGERRGALVAIDPGTGEVLAFVSKPSFDPNLFVEGIDVENWKALNESLDKPLLNRALRGTYPPGSTYKPFMALGALETGTRAAHVVQNDPGFYTFGGRNFRSHEGGLGGVDMHRAIQRSSNTYFYSLANEMGVDRIHDFMKPLGFGQVTGIDLAGESRGVLPSTAWKRNAYRKASMKTWFPGETISLGIGQGYNSFTMLQLASANATLANGGVKYTPHLVRAIQDPITGAVVKKIQPPGEDLGYARAHVEVVRNAMVAVTQGGTGTRVFAGAAYASAGKTGTAQAVTLSAAARASGKALDPRQRDHSLYMSFAPAADPTIAVAVIVENAGFGAAHAAPMVRRVFDYWISGLYPNEADMAAVREGKAGAPIGTPLPVQEVWPFDDADAAPADEVEGSPSEATRPA